MKRKDIKQTIKKFFFTYPTAKVRVRELERSLRLPLPSVIRYCRELEKEGIVGTERTGTVRFYTADRASAAYLLEKKLYNIKCLYDIGFIEHLKLELSNPAIILFGSYAKGEDTEESDIDIYLETPSKKHLNLDKFSKLLHRKVQVFQYKSLKDIANPHLANNIINGVILNKFVEVFT